MSQPDDTPLDRFGRWLARLLKTESSGYEPYTPSDPVIMANLENGYWGIMARPVLESFLENTRRVNRQNTVYARSAFVKDFESVRDRVAAAVGAMPEEIALTRGATEALQILIAGYNKLQPGDAVLYSDLDYNSM